MVSCSQVLFEHCVSGFLQSLQSDVLLLSCMPLPSSGSLLLVPISMARRGWSIVDPVEDDECHTSNHDKETTAQKDGRLEMEDIIYYQLNCLFFFTKNYWIDHEVRLLVSIILILLYVCDLRLIVMYCIWYMVYCIFVHLSIQKGCFTPIFWTDFIDSFLTSLM